jgi:Tfp pilus assembly protein PilF
LLRGNADTVIEVEIARASAFTEAGAHDLALKGIDAALERRPQHAQLRYQRAVVLDAAGRTSEAVTELEALLADRPDDATVLNALGYTLADRRMQLPRAEKLIRAALAQRPDNAAFVDSLGWVRYRRGDLKSAAAVLERAWRLTRQADIAAHWGEVLWESGPAIVRVQCGGGRSLRAPSRNLCVRSSIVTPRAERPARLVECFRCHHAAR